MAYIYNMGSTGVKNPVDTGQQLQVTGQVHQDARPRFGQRIGSFFRDQALQHADGFIDAGLSRAQDALRGGSATQVPAGGGGVWSSPAGGGMPGWVLPVAAVGAVGLVAFMVTRKD